jgi:lipopolysaccharide export system protein LptA
MPRQPKPPLPLARTVAALVLTGCSAAALVVSTHASGQGIAGFDSSAPVNYEADRIELQDKQKQVILSGNVDIRQGDLAMRAGRTVVAYTQGQSVQIQRIDAAGGVRVTRGNESAQGDVAVYDFNRRVITMVGNVALQRGSDNLRGGRLVIDLATGLSSVDGGGGGAGGSSGRVSGSFTVPKRN